MIFKLLLLITFGLNIYAREAYSEKRYEMLSGIRGVKASQNFWKLSSSPLNFIYGKNPSKFLYENIDYIPSGSRILDVGMGEGRNAVFVAKNGHRVVGIDIDEDAMKKAHLLAQDNGVKIDTTKISADKYSPEKNSFDVIMLFYFLDRKLNEKIIQWLRPGGLLIFESYTEDQLKVPSFEGYDKKYLLRPGELLTMFPRMKIIKYEAPISSQEYRESIILQKK